jgi:hypothetical protein
MQPKAQGSDPEAWLLVLVLMSVHKEASGTNESNPLVRTAVHLVEYADRSLAIQPLLPIHTVAEGTPVAVFAISFALALASLLIIIVRTAIDDLRKTRAIPAQLFLFGCVSLIFFKVVANMAANTCGH